MAGFTDPVERDLLDYFIATYGATTKYIGLLGADPTEAGTTLTEPSGGGYARISTASADWAAATGTAPASKANSAIKAFAAASGSWLSGANLTHFGIFSALTAGSLWWFAPLTVPKPVLSGDTPSFAAGSLVLKLGDPTDTY